MESQERFEQNMTDMKMLFGIGVFVGIMLSAAVAIVASFF